MKVPMVQIVCRNFAAAKLAHQEPAAIFAKPSRRQSKSPRCVQPASRSQVQYQVPIGIVFIDKAKSGTVDFIYLCSPCLRGDKSAENHFTTEARRTRRTP